MESKKVSSKDEERNKKELEYLPKIKEIENEFIQTIFKMESLLLEILVQARKEKRSNILRKTFAERSLQVIRNRKVFHL